MRSAPADFCSGPDGRGSILDARVTLDVPGPDGVYGSEVGVAPKADAAAEDDAYIVTITSDPANERSECWILDGRGIGDGPIARLRLPEQVSSGTHAAWAPGAALPA